MKILGIETSCDETAIAVVEATGSSKSPQFQVLGNALASQVEKHREYGGVYPSLAKREHAKNLVPVLELTLKEAGMLSEKEGEIPHEKVVKDILEREPGLFEKVKTFIQTHTKPDVDAIAVTQGPGLEPTLWVGLNFAKALAHIWDLPLIPVNHMEGHIMSVLTHVEEHTDSREVNFPAIALLVSGGHTQLVYVKNWRDYTIIGETRDDAVGEAFDKVARMLGLPYPGGPEISKLAEEARKRNVEEEHDISLPRPMIDTDDYDFSYSGLKTAVLYLIKKLGEIDKKTKRAIAREFEDAAIDVLMTKTKRAIEEHGAKTLIIGGGVVANKELRRRAQKLAEEESVGLLLPEQLLSTDNAIMIAVAGFFKQQEVQNDIDIDELRAEGTLRLGFDR